MDIYLSGRGELHERLSKAISRFTPVSGTSLVNMGIIQLWKKEKKIKSDGGPSIATQNREPFVVAGGTTRRADSGLNVLHSAQRPCNYQKSNFSWPQMNLSYLSSRTLERGTMNSDDHSLLVIGKYVLIIKVSPTRAYQEWLGKLENRGTN